MTPTLTLTHSLVLKKRRYFNQGHVYFFNTFFLSQYFYFFYFNVRSIVYCKIAICMLNIVCNHYQVSQKRRQQLKLKTQEVVRETGVKAQHPE